MSFPAIESSAQPKSAPRAFPRWVSAARLKRSGPKQRAPIPDRDGVEVGAVLGTSRTQTTVTLHAVGSLEPTFTVILEPNRHGQLPTVLVDPVDVTGRVLFGMWLGDGYDGTKYELTSRRDENGSQTG